MKQGIAWYLPWLRSLGFLALAFAICLSGYRYKLSLYHVHSDPSVRLSVAKLWLEPRNARGLDHSLRKVASPPAFAALNVPSERKAPIDVTPLPQAPRLLQVRAALLPSLPPRSPPVDFLSRA